MRNILLLFNLFIFLFITFDGYTQVLLSECDSEEIFSEKGEIFFLLEDAAGEIQNLTRIISVDNVENGDVYAYASLNEFIKLQQSYNFSISILPKPSELFNVPMSDSPRAVLDWNYYPTYQAYLQIMQDFQTNFPQICKIDTIGLSVEGRLILAARISDNVGLEENEPEFLYTSSIHGDETTGYILTLHLIDYLLLNYSLDQRVTNLVNNMDIWINPLANPDGTYAGGNNSVNGATRYNANWVDLNRNYPDPDEGPHPDGNDWQTETIAFMEFAEERDFTMSANFHGGAEVVNYPWDTWSRYTADDNWWMFVSREYADTVHAHAPSGYLDDLNNGITNGYAWYRITGGRQDYMNYFQQCREVTLEISNTKLLPANQLLNHWEYNYRSMINYMEQSLYGLRGIITDTISGEPIIGQVYIANHDKDSSMVFSSVPIGNYHRLLKAGTYNITFFAEGYSPKTYKNVVIADKESTVLNVRLWDGTPIPSFESTDTLIVPGESVQFFDNSGGSPISRLWTFEGGIPATSNETNPFVQYMEEGSFNVSLTVTNIIGSNTISVDDYITVDDGIGISEPLIQQIAIYPNPVKTGKLNVKSARSIIGYDLIDNKGVVVLSEETDKTIMSIDLSEMKSGIYFLKLRTHDADPLFKIIVE